MAIYVAEAFLSRARASELEALQRMLRKDLLVRHVLSYFTPDEETAFHLLEATSVEAVREALARAGITADRIGLAESLPVDPGRLAGPMSTDQG